MFAFDPQMQEIDGSSSGGAELRVESVPFSDIPGQSRLFLRYLADPLSLKIYYPNAVASHQQLADLVPQVLDSYTVDRDPLCGALSRMNAEGSDRTRANIELLRSRDTVAVVTGQQAGLFSGPLYTIYKALTAVRLSECLRERGRNAVPVFWAATEDHDFDEISSVNVIDSEGRLRAVKTAAPPGESGFPVGKINFDASISDSIEEVFALLPHTQFSNDIRDLITETYTEGRTFGSAFTSLIGRLFAGHGLIVVDPLDGELKRLAAPIYGEAVRRSTEINGALLERNAPLRAEGYEPQVLVEQDYFPLFWHSDDGRRLALRKIDGEIAAPAERRKFSVDELVEAAAREPERFSPGVMLRPVVQDYLFPTVCYFGGGAEIAYFAQNSEVYRTLGRPVTPILHRQSFTVIEPKHVRTMKEYAIEFADLLGSRDDLAERIVREIVDPANSRLFPDAEEKINVELNRLDRHLSDIDPTLARNLATRRRKIIYHIGALNKKFHRARLEKDGIASRRLSSLFDSLYPQEQLQERALNVIPFLNKHGRYFLDWVYRSIDLDDRGHRIMRL